MHWPFEVGRPKALSTRLCDRDRTAPFAGGNHKRGQYDADEARSGARRNVRVDAPSSDLRKDDRQRCRARRQQCPVEPVHGHVHIATVDMRKPFGNPPSDSVSAHGATNLVDAGTAETSKCARRPATQQRTSRSGGLQVTMPPTSKDLSIQRLQPIATAIDIDQPAWHANRHEGTQLEGGLRGCLHTARHEGRYFRRFHTAVTG